MLTVLAVRPLRVHRYYLRRSPLQRVPSSSPGKKERSIIEEALGTTLEATLADSQPARQGQGTTLPLPKGGHTLKLSRAAGVSIGQQVKQVNWFGEAADLGHNALSNLERVLTELRNMPGGGPRPMSPSSTPSIRAERSMRRSTPL
jgi:hypothetical protein